MNELERVGNSKSEKILNDLPIDLQVEVKLDFYRRILQKSDILSYNFSNDFIKELALSMKEMTASPGQDIFKTKQQDIKIFFVYQGQIELSIKCEDDEAREFQEHSRLMSNKTIDLGTIKVFGGGKIK